MEYLIEIFTEESGIGRLGHLFFFGISLYFLRGKLKLIKSDLKEIKLKIQSNELLNKDENEKNLSKQDLFEKKKQKQMLVVGLLFGIMPLFILNIAFNSMPIHWIYSFILLAVVPSDPFNKTQAPDTLSYSSIGVFLRLCISLIIVLGFLTLISAIIDNFL